MPGPVDKSASAYRTISEVAAVVGAPQHVLRFWETRFPQIQPLKRGGNRRYYRPEDVTLLQSINRLLYTEGYTIKGVQKLLAEGGLPAASAAQPVAAQPAATPVALGSLTAIRAHLAAARDAAHAI